MTRDERRRAGAALRGSVPRSAHAEYAPAPGRADPVDILIAQGEGRIAALLPERYRRMSASPFAFLRGAAAIMAADLAATPACGLRVQASGDAHLMNFGAFATPDGQPVFDLNDFDETLAAPFEWDLKRLAASLAVAGRVAGLGDKAVVRLARQAARGYGEVMDTLAGLSPLEVWHYRIDLRRVIDGIDEARTRKRMLARLEAAMRGARGAWNLVDARHARLKLRQRPPLIVRLGEHDEEARSAFDEAIASLPEDRRVLLGRFRLADVMFKAVGVGSVGTYCVIGLFADADGAPLLLQLKQAQTSVLAPFAGVSGYANQGERVVVGQRLLQAASDVFLGWGRAAGRDVYLRRLKDSRLAAIGTKLEERDLPFYADLCGRTLARAHARAGDPAAIAGYVGQGHAFDHAIGDFALAYAEQTQRDFRVFRAAIGAGRISTHVARPVS